MTARPSVGLVAVGAVAVAVVAVAALLAAGRGALGFGAEPEVVAAFAGQHVGGGGQVGDSVIVATSTLRGRGDPATTLIELDARSGDELARSHLVDANAVDGLAVVDDSVVLRVRSRVPDVAAAEVWWPESARFAGELWLAVVDPDGLEPVRQYQIAPFDKSDGYLFTAEEPMTVIDGVYWLLGSGMGQGPIDIRTGQSQAEPNDWLPTIRSVHHDDGELVIVRAARIQTFDLATGQLIVDHGFADLQALPIGSGFRYHENQIWMSGIQGDDWDQFYRYDIDTLTMSDPRPNSDFPNYAFESGRFRWEMRRNSALHVPAAVLTAEPGDRWRQVDIETGETVDELDLGRWLPRFATDDHLWLTRSIDDGTGEELGRLELG